MEVLLTLYPLVLHRPVEVTVKSGHKVNGPREGVQVAISKPIRIIGHSVAESILFTRRPEARFSAYDIIGRLDSAQAWGIGRAIN